MRHWRGLLLLATVLLCLAPVLQAPTRYFIGAPWIDGYGTQWFYWYAAQVLEGKQSFQHTDLLFYPWGKDVYLHTGGNLLDAWLALPLRVLFGQVLGYNLWCALLLAGNYLGGTCLAAALGVPKERRWLAGLVLILNPYVLLEWQQGRPTQATLLLPALATAGLWHLVENGQSWRRRLGLATLTGLALGLSGLQYWYYGLMLGGLALVFGVAALVTGPERGARLGALMLAAGVALGVTLPVAAPMLGALDHGEVPGLISLQGDGILAPLEFRTRQGDDIGLYVLDLLGGTSGSLIDHDGIRYAAGTPVLSRFWPLWLLFGLWTLREKRTFLIGIAAWALVAMNIAQGPAWVWGEEILARNPLYFALLEHVQVMQRWWWPGRAVFALWLVLAALLPLLVGGRGGRAWGLAWLLGTAWELREVLPLGRWDGASSPALECLRAAPDGAVIELPYIRQQESLYFQTLHGKPLLGGMLVTKPSFGPPELPTLLHQNRLLERLVNIGQRDYSPGVPADPADRQALLDLGYRYLLVEIPGFLRPKPRGDGGADTVSDWGRGRRLLVDVLGTTPLLEDERFALWALGEPPTCP